jgi:hypothetical protein
MKLLKCLNKAKVPSSTALRSLVLLVLKDCLHTLPQAWRNRINKTAALEYAEQGISECRLSRSYTNDGSPYGKKKEAIEQFTLEPVGRMGQPENSQCRSMDVLRRSLFVTGHAMA